MPVAPAIIAAVIGAAATATEVGLQLSGAGQPGQPKPVGPTPTPTSQLTAAIAPQALSIESATGGSVSPDYLSTIAPIQAGAGGQANTPSAIQQVLQQILGQPGGSGGGGASPSSLPTAPFPSNPPFTPTGLPVNLAALAATPGASDFLTKIAAGL